MGQMKDFLVTVHNGGDEAVAAVQRVGEDWRTQLEQAAAEIARLRLAIRRLAEQDATLSVVRGNVVVEMDATLTDAEREAVDTAEASLMRESTDLNTPLPVRQRLGAAAAILRGLLERLGATNKTDGYVE